MGTDNLEEYFISDILWMKGRYNSNMSVSFNQKLRDEFTFELFIWPVWILTSGFLICLKIAEITVAF